VITIDIPGQEALIINHVVLDYNGILAVDGCLIKGIRQRLVTLCRQIPVHVLTADTYGSVRRQCEGIGVLVETFPHENASGPPCGLKQRPGLG